MWETGDEGRHRTQDERGEGAALPRPCVPHGVATDRSRASGASAPCRHGSQSAITAGSDGQQVIPWDSPEEVRAEMRHSLDTCWCPDEGCRILTTGNGIDENCPLPGLAACFDEALTYGEVVVGRPA